MTHPWKAILDTYDTLPWPELEVPEYSEATKSDWKLEKKNFPMIRGYFKGLQAPKHDNWVLTKGGQFWMSLTPMETESQAPHAAAATGHTVIMGFGMGMLTYNVLKNPAVTKVTVIEIDPEVVELIKEVSDMDNWPGIEKMTMVYADALEWKPSEPVDVVLADIWENLGEESLRPDLVKIYENTKPTVIAGWGMELDYISWMNDNGYSEGDETTDTYYEYAEDIGLPLIEKGNDWYPKLAVTAAYNVTMY